MVHRALRPTRAATLIRMRCLFRDSAVVVASWLLVANGYADSAPRATVQRDFELAHRLEHGDGIPRDLRLAVALYCDAARAGHTLAQYHLGWMYANGRGVARDDAIAKYFFELAAAQGDQQAARISARLSTPPAPPPECMRTREVAAAPTAPEPPPPIADAVLAQPESEPILAPNDPPSFVPADRGWIATLVRRQAPRFGIAPELALAVIAVESNFNPLARSPRNAMGLMQLIPETADRFRVVNIFDPLESVRGGLAYLRWLLAYYRGDLDLALAAYNAGEGAVDRFGGIPPYPETRDYVRRVRALFQESPHPFDASVTPASALLRRNRPLVRD